MIFSLLGLFRGPRHDFDLLTMLRGETHVEIVPDGHVAVIWIARGTAAISRPWSARSSRSAGCPSSR